MPGIGAYVRSVSKGGEGEREEGREEREERSEIHWHWHWRLLVYLLYGMYNEEARSAAAGRGQRQLLATGVGGDHGIDHSKNINKIITRTG
eukprot:COSAG01_NODE_7023_length_3386_cov_27.126559_4_plen_91_part_00